MDAALSLPERPLRVICWEGGPFHDHPRILRGIVRALKERGLVDNDNVPVPSDHDTGELWRWLARHAGGRVVFLEDGFYSSGWDAKLREKTFAGVKRRVEETGDVDLVLAFDTWTAEDALRLDTDVPVIVSSVSSLADRDLAGRLAASGRRNVAVVHEPDRIYRQVRLFHRIFGFRTLGVVFEDTPEGRALVGLDEIRRAAEDVGATLVPCTGRLVGLDEAESEKAFLACHRELAQKRVDAVFLTFSLGPAREWNVRASLEPLIDADIPTFSEKGGQDVLDGALMSSGVTDNVRLGEFTGNLAARALAGEEPASMDTARVAAGGMVLNLDTAAKIGWDPPLEVLAEVDAFVDRHGLWLETDEAP